MYAEALQFVGTLVTVAGLVVVAPVEAGRVLPRLVQWLIGKGRQLRRWTARFLPFLRQEGKASAGTAHSVLTMRDAVWAVGRVGVIDRDSTEEQLAALRRAVESIYSELTGLQEGQNALKAELNARLDQLTQDLAELRHRVEEQQREQTLLNGRGFPLAATGALLAGTPGAWLVSTNVLPDGTISTGPAWPWWPLAMIGVGAVVVAWTWLRQEWGNVRSGWREEWPPHEQHEPAREAARNSAPVALEKGEASQPAIEERQQELSEPEEQPT